MMPDYVHMRRVLRIAYRRANARFPAVFTPKQRVDFDIL